MVEFLKLDPIQLNRKINEFSPLKIDNKIFNASHLWEIPNEELYPNEIKEEINNLKVLITDFIYSGYSPEFCKQNMRQFKIFRKLALDLSRHENIIDALIFSKYWINSDHWNVLGKQIAKILIFAENLKHGEIPVTESRVKKFEMCRKILTVIKAGTWKRYTTWDEFLTHLYGKNWKELAKFLEEFPFEKLIKHLPYLDLHEPDKSKYISHNFLSELSKRNTVETIKSLYYACQMGFYETNGIFSWHEFLYWCQTFPPLQIQFDAWDLGWKIGIGYFKDKYIAKNKSKKIFSFYRFVFKGLYNLKLY